MAGHPRANCRRQDGGILKSSDPGGQPAGRQDGAWSHSDRDTPRDLARTEELRIGGRLCRRPRRPCPRASQRLATRERLDQWRDDLRYLPAVGACAQRRQPLVFCPGCPRPDPIPPQSASRGSLLVHTDGALPAADGLWRGLATLEEFRSLVALAQDVVEDDLSFFRFDTTAG